MSIAKTMSLQLVEVTRKHLTLNDFFLHACVDAFRSTCLVSKLTASVRVQVDLTILVSISHSTILLGVPCLAALDSLSLLEIVLFALVCCVFMN